MIETAPSADVGAFLDVNGIRTFFREQGDGEAVVLIHGARPETDSHGSWRANVAPLARAGFWVIAYDRPGFGQSDASEGTSLDDHVRHAKQFLDALGLTHVHLVGCDAGGVVAARLALEDPRVDRLVLISSGALAAGGPAEADLARLTPKTLILWGKHDPDAPVERGLRLFDLIPGAELHVFDGSGHAMQRDRAERFNTLVSDFLKA